MRRCSRKCKAIVSLFLFGCLVWYLEVISYVVNTNSWVRFSEGPPEDLGGIPAPDEPLRILAVADPQIQGEEDEPPFLGLFTRWDSDRYLHRNYMLAKHHVRPHVVIFLGDLMDEGSRAPDAVYRRYYRRFAEIYDLPRRQDPSPLLYLFLPGDNDVGGEGIEEVNPVKLRWFNQTFGDYSKTKAMHMSDWSVQLYPMNLFIPHVNKDPLSGLVNSLGHSQINYRVLVSHVSLLGLVTSSVQSVLDQIMPSLILSAHSHKSVYYAWKVGSDKALHVVQDFLVSHRPKKHWTPPEQDSFSGKTSIRLQLEKTTQTDKKIIYEIGVPSCSYRMGVPDMGFGYLELHKNGTMQYTVLWLPSRFKQLYAYLGVYILMKLILTPWLAWKVLCYAASRYQTWRRAKQYEVYHQC